MSPEWIIGVVAVLAIGGTIAIGLFHFGVYLRDPATRDATRKVADDLKLASTRLSVQGTNVKSLEQRLDEAPKLNERLSSRQIRSAGVSELLFETKWSDLRSALKLPPK